MLESNTEAKQATGTGSKLGPGWGGERGRGATLPSGLTTTALGLGLTTAGETALDSAYSPGNQRWGAMGSPRLARREREPRPSPLTKQPLSLR